MLTKLLAALWRKAPKSLRRWGVRLTQTSFTVTTAAVVLDERGRVLLLNHRFRAGRNGWGIPGGFIEEAEQPEDALRRELHEEVGLKVEQLEIAFARTLKRPAQIEIIFRCRSAGEVRPRSKEIESAVWCELDNLPPELNKDQRGLIRRALEHGAETAS